MIEIINARRRYHPRLEGIPSYWAYWRIINTLSQQPMGFEHERSTVKANEQSEPSETQAERRERQAREIAAIVDDVVNRDFWTAFDIANTTLPLENSESNEDSLARTTRYMKHIGGVGQALIDALGRLVNADSETTARALKIIQGPHKERGNMWDPQWRGQPDPFIGVGSDFQSLSDDDVNNPRE